MLRFPLFLAALVMFLSPLILLVLTAANLPARGAGRRWYAVPWIPVVLHACWIGLALLADRTSHNLFPFELGVSGVAGLLIFGVLHYAGVLPRQETKERS